MTRTDRRPVEFASIYAVNTAGSVLGSLAAGFVLIPAFGLETTLQGRCALPAAGGGARVAVVARCRGRRASLVWRVGVAALFVMALSATVGSRAAGERRVPVRAVCAEGSEPRSVAQGGNVALLPRGRGRHGVGQAAHRHDDAGGRRQDRRVESRRHADAKAGGAPAAAAARQPARRGHRRSGQRSDGGRRAYAIPIARVDVIEISPEVVEASRIFHRREPPRACRSADHLLVGDGRSHLQLSRRKYDVIISEPSNPWIAGVAALFTREFFLAARDRLAPGGLICQWANAYNISDARPPLDRRDVPVGLSARHRVARRRRRCRAAGVGWAARRATGEYRAHWSRPGVAEDLATVAALEPFALWSLFVAGPAELERYASGPDVLTDDRMRSSFRVRGSCEARAPEKTAHDHGPARAEAGRSHSARRAEAQAEQWRRRGG